MTVTLRPLRTDDADQVLAWRNSPAVAPYMYSDHPIGPYEHRAWIARAAAGGDCRYWIILLDGAAVGLANVVRIDVRNSRCDWAYYLADPATRGRGVGATVEFLVLAYVFDRLGLNRLWCEVFVDNEAVWKMHESYGFTREALFRDHISKGGRFHDVVGLGMLAAEWPAAKAAALARLAERGVTPAELEATLVDMG
ncbi:MAG: UDP-4-amino-4,6-dideoxy-N-acetyl-beta-L-altrosamine N-acetyltransferase [Caulobacter sp.]|nr:UDP-4-amino-4,6-dideoxy-N-acetyl-beta-L-altrosamine N-acetyltransferase [Caulobacter sp.]